MKNNSSQIDFFKNNYIFKIYNSLWEMLAYKPRTYPDPFVLAETETENESAAPAEKKQDAAQASLKDSLKILKDSLDYAKDLAGVLEDVISHLKNEPAHKTDTLKLHIHNNIAKLSQRKTELALPLRAFDNALSPGERTVSSCLAENEGILRRLYHSPANSDLIFHRFEISGQPPLAAMLVFFDGMVDRQVIDLSVLEPLILPPLGCEKTNTGTTQISSDILKKRLPNHITTIETNYQEISRAINSGDAALFIDGANEAIALDTKGYEHRGVETAQIEQSLQGTQSAFTEVIQINTAMIRSIMPTSDLIGENVTVGDRIQTPCAVMYLKSLANADLVKEVKRRLAGIRTDYIIDIGTLNQFIEDQPKLFFPKSLQTERPDRVALHLTEGRVAILMHGAPFALIVPVNFFTFFHFVDDYSLHPPLVNFTRLIRISGIFISMLLSSLYIAFSYFHQEAIPTELALAIDVYREKVPFPIITELFAMEIAFEMIREAGLRVPGVLGSTITIVGAIIIGQAAVTANLVSPIVVVLVSLTALASFAVPDYRLAAVFRIARFGFLFLAYFLGLEGIGVGIYLFILLLCHTKSFGVPYFVPWGPKTAGDFDAVFRGSVFNKEARPDFLNPKDGARQPRVSREWALQEDNTEGVHQK